MQAYHINCITVGDESKPIVILDGDLYDRAVKLKDYEDKLVHQTWSPAYHDGSSQVLGKYIE